MGITGWMLSMFCVRWSGPDVKVGVVLERHADQIADRVLGQLGQLLGAQRGMRGCGGERRVAVNTRKSTEFARFWWWWRSLRILPDRLKNGFPADIAAGQA